MKLGFHMDYQPRIRFVGRTSKYKHGMLTPTSWDSVPPELFIVKSIQLKLELYFQVWSIQGAE